MSLTVFLGAYGAVGVACAVIGIIATNQGKAPSRGDMAREFVLWTSISPFVILLFAALAPIWGLWALLGRDARTAINLWLDKPLFSKPLPAWSENDPRLGP